MSSTETTLDVDRLRGVEAILFIADQPVSVDTLAESLEVDPSSVDVLLRELQQRLDERESGLTLRQVAGGWRLYTAPAAREHVERHVLSGRSGRLSNAALETLAVVAYKQPISRTEIGDVRAVNADGAVRSLVQRGLIEEVGRDDGPGQAVLYGTTITFLERLGLDTVDQLPSLADFLPEHPAPDEPAADRIKQARRLLQSGRELPSTGAASWDPDADEPEPPEEGADEDVAVTAAEQRREHIERRRDQDQRMDALTDRLEEAAQSAMARLRVAVEATEDDEADEEDDEVVDAQDAGAESDVAGSGDDDA